MALPALTTPALTTVRARTVFAPLDEGGRAGTVARRLAQAITLGLLLDGERLPAETQLAGQFGVSPVTLREALAELREAGLVETRRGRRGGSFIRAPDGAQAGQLTGQLRRCPCTNCGISATTGRPWRVQPPGWPRSGRWPGRWPRCGSTSGGCTPRAP